MAVLDRSDVRRAVDKIRRVIEGLDRPDDQELPRLHSRYCEYVVGAKLSQRRRIAAADSSCVESSPIRTSTSLRARRSPSCTRQRCTPAGAL